MSKTWHLTRKTDGTQVTIELSDSVNKGVYYAYTDQDWDWPGQTFQSKYFQPLNKLLADGLDLVPNNAESRLVLKEILALLQA